MPLHNDVDILAAFVRETSGILRRHYLHYELLPYHRYGESKYGFLGLTPPMTSVVPTAEEAAVHAELARYRARERATVPLSPAQGAPLVERLRGPTAR